MILRVVRKLYLAFQGFRMYALIVSSIIVLLCTVHASAAITLSPSGMVSVCPGGQVLLTCERTSGSILYWDISVPMITTLDRIVTSQGSLLLPDFRIGFAEFNISRTSDSPLISRLLINNVTTDINVYCSEDGNENGAPMAAMNVIGSIPAIPSDNITVDSVSYSSSNITVNLALSAEGIGPEILFNVSTVPPIGTPAVYNSNEVIQLTLLYNIVYNVSIESVTDPYCGHQAGASTTIQLKYTNCGYPLSGSSSSLLVANFSDPAISGMVVVFGCSEDLVLTGPDSATCMDNGEWEPDPREFEARCKANCGRAVPPANGYINDYSSTLEGANVTFTCDKNVDAQVFAVASCNASGRWNPNPFEFCMDTHRNDSTETSDSQDYTLLTIVLPVACGTVLLFILIIFVIILCVIRRMRTHVAKKSLEDHINQQPTYEEITQCCKDSNIEMELNTSYGHIVTHSTQNHLTVSPY